MAEGGDPKGQALHPLPQSHLECLTGRIPGPNLRPRESNSLGVSLGVCCYLGSQVMGRHQDKGFGITKTGAEPCFCLSGAGDLSQVT